MTSAHSLVPAPTNVPARRGHRSLVAVCGLGGAALGGLAMWIGLGNPTVPVDILALVAGVAVTAWLVAVD